jgi:hypothetical protein
VQQVRERGTLFAHMTGAKLQIVEGQPPMAIERLTFDDVERV